MLDVLVVGCGPAGCAAAIRAARAGRSVQLVAREAPPRDDSGAAWIGPSGVALCESLGLGGGLASPFRGMRLYSGDFKKHADLSDAALCGWIVERRAFNEQLLKASKKAGARLTDATTVRGVRLGEAAAELELEGGKSLQGRVLIIADGIDAPVAKLAGIAPTGLRLPKLAFADWRCAGKPALGVIVLSGRTALIATLVRAESTLRLALAGRDADSDVEAALSALITAGQAAGALPKAAPQSRGVTRSPAGAALDIESHVGKRCLLCGDAGGFVAAFSHEGIYPAMKSGVIAVDVALRALDAPLPQDELASFGAAWRTELAACLRMPSTDLALLAPLVFSNAQMSKRVGQAFLLGQSF